MGCHSRKSNDLSVHAGIDSTGYVRILWESSEDDKCTRAAIFEVTLGKKQKRQSQIRASEQLIRYLLTWSLLQKPLKAVTSIPLKTISCLRQNMFQDTKERQLVTRSGLERLRCCVCHLHHEQVMKAPCRVRQLFATVLQQVHRFKGEVIAGDANACSSQNKEFV